MFSSAMNYLAGAASSVASGAYPSTSNQARPFDFTRIDLDSDSIHIVLKFSYFLFCN